MDTSIIEHPTLRQAILIACQSLHTARALKGSRLQSLPTTDGGPCAVMAHRLEAAELRARQAQALLLIEQQGLHGQSNNALPTHHSSSQR